MELALLTRRERSWAAAARRLSAAGYEVRRPGHAGCRLLVIDAERDPAWAEAQVRAIREGGRQLRVLVAGIGKHDAQEVVAAGADDFARESVATPAFTPRLALNVRAAIAGMERDRYFTQSIDLLAAIDERGRIQWHNPAWQTALGYPANELKGRHLLRLVHPEHRRDARRAAGLVAAGEPLVSYRTRFVARDGGTRWLSWNVTPLEPGGLAYCVARDVTAIVEADGQRDQLLSELEVNNRALEQQARLLNQLRLQAEFAATHDSLTGALDRRAWRELSARIAPTAVALFDIDHFKEVNDRYGHPVGDHVLREVAWRLHAVLGVEAIIGRLGGEEFGAIFRGPFFVAEAYCGHVVRMLAEQPVRLASGELVTVTVSGGLAPWNAGHLSREDSLDRTYADADRALYEAKHGGRQRLVVRRERGAAA